MLLELSNKRASGLVSIDQSLITPQLASILGVCKITPAKIVIGITISHSGSTERSVICLGLPPQIRLKTRIRLKAIKPLINSNNSARAGFFDHRCAIRVNIAQNPPKGGKPIKPNIPIKKQMPEIGRRFQRPLIMVRSWLIVLEIMLPMEVSNRAIAKA